MSRSEDAANLIDNEEFDQAQLSTSEFESVQLHEKTNDSPDVELHGKANDSPDVQLLGKVNDSSDVQLRDKENGSPDASKSENDSQKDVQRESGELHLRVPLDFTKYIIKNRHPNCETTNGHALQETHAAHDVENTADEANALHVYYNDAVVVNDLDSFQIEDGTTQTQEEHTQDFQSDTNEIPLRRRKIRLLQAFSFIAVLLFFPLGVPAVCCAHKIERELNHGIMQGNIDKATKLIKWTEKLIILSFIAAFIVVIGIFVTIERQLVGDDNAYLANKRAQAFLFG